MRAPRKYARTIDAAFEALTLDGVRMGRLDAWMYFDRLGKSRRKEETWKEDLKDLMQDLALMGGSSIRASTSGTTGPPRHLRIQRRDLVNSARLTGDTFGLKENDRVLLCLPCAYIAGKMMVVRAMALGLDLHIIDPRGSVLDNLDACRDRFRFTAMVPLQLHRAIQEDRARVEEQFHTILLGGGPVSAVLEEDLQGLKTEVFQSYGSTETVTHVALRKLNGKGRGRTYGAIGKVTFDKDEDGCLVVHTPHLSRKQHITNDLVELQDERHFQWLGRVDNVILSGGKKIYPESLEARTAGLIPYPHFFMSFPEPKLGEAVMLVLETEDGPQVIHDVLDKLFTVLSIHEMPRRVTALREFSRTASGKLIRQL